MSAIEIRVVREVPADFYGPALRAYLNGAAAMAAEYLVDPGLGRTPRDEGFLANSMSPGAGGLEVDQREPPEWARVGVPRGATNGEGTSIETYGSVLEESSRYHYRGGPNAGKKTQGWFTSVVEYMTSKAGGALLDDLARGIEAAWQR